MLAPYVNKFFVFLVFECAILTTMRYFKNPIVILFFILYTLLYTTSIIFLSFGLYCQAIVFSFPTLFLIPIYLTFIKIPNQVDQHVFFLILSILLRFLLSLLAIAIPALLWYFIEPFKNTMNSIFLLVPFFEVMLIYIIIISLFIKKTKKE